MYKNQPQLTQFIFKNLRNKKFNNVYYQFVFYCQKIAFRTNLNVRRPHTPDANLHLFSVVEIQFNLYSTEKYILVYSKVNYMINV